MKHYSYFVIKPDGIRHMDKIIDEIHKGEFSSIYFYAIHDFENIIKKLYFKHYKEKGKDFKKGFESYLYGIKQIYNNFGILLVVGDDNRSYEELVKQVFETKMKVRDELVNDNIGIATNVPGEEENYIKIISKNGENKRIRCLNNPGFHRINDLNFIHCPDPKITTTLEELDILYNNGIISDENLISSDMIKKIIRYKCNNFIEDMREENYQGEVTPNISGFIRKSIKDDEEIR